MRTNRASRAAAGSPWWGGVACVWALLFAAPHFYWAAGGRWGLGAQAAAADQALQQRWFFTYNLLVGVLSVGGAVLAVALARPHREGPVRRLLRAAAWVACGVLALRGAVGVAALSLDVATGALDSPLVLVLMEPWFVLGGIAFGGLAATSRPVH